MKRLFFGLLLCAARHGQAWTSAFAPPDSAGGVLRPVVKVGGRDFQLPDYSYAGYKLSQAGLGDGIPCYGVSLTAADGADISSDLAAAVSTVAAAGGGTVHLPPGSFVLSRTVWIHSNHLRIVGAGSSKTVLIESSAYAPMSDYYEGPLSFNAGGDPWTPVWMQESRALAATSSSDVPRGGRRLTLGSSQGLAVGDWVVLQQLFWPELSRQAGAGTWPTGYAKAADWQFSLTYVRKIASLDGLQATLDAPVPHALLNARRAVRLFKPRPELYIEDVGLEGVSIQVQPNTHNTGAGAGRPAGIAVNFKSAFNAWCRDVKVSDIAKNGFQPCWSARVTFLDCAVRGAQDWGGGGFGYAFHSYASQELLYKRCVAEDVRHGFIHQYPMCSDIVMTQCQSLKPAGKRTQNADVDDSHLAYCQQLLWDEHAQRNTGIQAMDRGARSGPQTQETFASGTVWNYSNDGEAYNWQAGKVQLSPVTTVAGDDAEVIGVSGASAYDGTEDADPTLPGTLMQGAALQRGPRGNVAYEGLGQAGLQPASLFDALLFTRNGHAMPPETAPPPCGPATGP